MIMRRLKARHRVKSFGSVCGPRQLEWGDGGDDDDGDVAVLSEAGYGCDDEDEVHCVADNEADCWCGHDDDRG